jgi:hypothetical protein
VRSGKRVEPSEVGGPGEFETMTDEELERALTERAQKCLALCCRRDAALSCPCRVLSELGQAQREIRTFNYLRLFGWSPVG